MNEKNEICFLMDFFFKMNQIRQLDFIKRKNKISSQNNSF